jgi:uncharacterized protein YkwD
VLAEWSRAARGALRPGRRVLPLVIGVVVGLFAFTVPVVSGVLGRGSVSLDASSTSSAHARGDSPVVMGEDGRPVAAGSAGVGAATGTTAGRAGGSTAGGSTAGGSSRAGSPAAGVATGAGTAGSVPGPGSSTAAGTTATAPGTSPGSSTSTAWSSRSSSSSSSAASAPASSSAPVTDPTTPAPAGPDLVPGAEDAILADVNSARTDAGCARLTPDGTLGTQAQGNSLDMAAAGTLALLDPVATAAAIAQGQADAASAVATWLAVPTDRAHLLDCAMTSAGAAEATGPGGPWWTLVLA